MYPDLKINTISIDRVSEFNFLGLIISSDLKWSKHIDHTGFKNIKSNWYYVRCKTNSVRRHFAYYI